MIVIISSDRGVVDKRNPGEFLSLERGRMNSKPDVQDERKIGGSFEYKLQGYPWTLTGYISNQIPAKIVLVRQRLLFHESLLGLTYNDSQTHLISGLYTIGWVSYSTMDYLVSPFLCHLRTLVTNKYY